MLKYFSSIIISNITLIVVQSYSMCLKTLRVCADMLGQFIIKISLLLPSTIKQMYASIKVYIILTPQPDQLSKTEVIMTDVDTQTGNSRLHCTTSDLVHLGKLA